MRSLNSILRIIFGVTFIVSGFTKLIDPVGTGLVVKEYFSFMHLGFLDPLSTYFGLIMSTLEMLTGICVITGVFLSIFTFIGMVMMAAFTLVTVYLAIYNPISDCGCFGEAIHLTNIQTLGKNLVLLPISILLFVWNRKRLYNKPLWLDCAAVALFAFFACGIGVRAWRGIPTLDYTAYRVGTDMAAVAEGNGTATFETTFIYEKDGVRQNFTLDNLPDDSWTFVDSVTEMTGGDTSEAFADIALRDAEGNYRNDLFAEEGVLVAGVVWDSASMSDARWARLRDLSQQLEIFEMPLFIFSDSSEVPGDLGEHLLTADRKSLLTLMRDNGGVVYLSDGVITRKWASKELSGHNVLPVLEEDEDMVLLSSTLERKHYTVRHITHIAILIALYFLIHNALLKRRREENK